MGLRKKCRYCGSQTIARRLMGFYLGSNDKTELWECRECFGIWSNKTK